MGQLISNRTKMIMKFQDVRIFTLNIRCFKQGAALTLPRIGIFVGKGYEHNQSLLRHEYGHVLQFRKWGWWFFWRHIAINSLDSAKYLNTEHHSHQATWTEWSANRLSYHYFKQPTDWDFQNYPIAPPAVENSYSKPCFIASNSEFIHHWIDNNTR